MGSKQASLSHLKELGDRLSNASDTATVAREFASSLVQLGATGAVVSMDAETHTSPLAISSGDITDSEAETTLELVTASAQHLGRARINGAEQIEPAALALSHQMTARALEAILVKHELAERREEIQRAGSLAALGMLAASLVHEARNPLVSIKTFLQLLPERSSDPEFMGEFLDLVETEVSRVTTLLDQLLDLARPVRPSFTDTDLNKLVQRALTLVAGELYERRIVIATDLAADLPLVRIDPAQIHQVCVNLLINAAQASPDGSRIFLSTVDQKNTVSLSVSDRGVGVAEELKTKLFEPFASDKKEGYGLGLAVARQIVESHGGALEFKSRPGETTFTVCLPLNR